MFIVGGELTETDRQADMMMLIGAFANVNMCPQTDHLNPLVLQTQS